MNKSIIGKYLNIDTPIHKLDPRLKFLGNILFIVLFFLAEHYLTLGVLVILSMVIYILATKSVKSVFKKLKLPLYIALFLLIINMFTVKGAVMFNDVDKYIPLSSEVNADAYVIYRGKLIVNVTYLAPKNDVKSIFQLNLFTIHRSVTIFLRIYGVILITTSLTVSTKPVLLTRAINDLLYPLKLIKIPTEIITMIISIALRFIPTLLDEAGRIMKAQSSRGIDFKNGSFKDKTKSFIVLMIPLFVSSFNKANDLADAMTSRGYEPYSKRTHYRVLRPNWRDIITTIILVGLTSMIIVTKIDQVYLPSWWLLTFQRV
ncbi:energy-coupling factor transporter transmembrane protein EcfT [Mycoplasma enhydrae]|uniref:energy-coupling factor transporter transmembrane component T family protein n=1 Tax=Mycoplasma enhydrae TaxID=2499220 RepID=UPI00197B2D21|nr:energy-coupling factor transporter transmembrane component T [Mycoplasma enhydrae]MBN4089487.1 energy-coupling factor transporter transmembrane protein EcfT [Mycoplasma enhydrae]MCV3733668.1 energy-coupling factor transporter transmembrane protein EcfT [Mycoplasma enhydrae]MCV3753351.1 energy-coupling factor transporter transmembrane protein EcfT [Mycoplasma enhydrae]